MVRGEAYTNKVDIWGLGCILYELCTARKAFSDDWSIMNYALGSVSTPEVSSAHRSKQEPTILLNVAQYTADIWSAVRSLEDIDGSLHLEPPYHGFAEVDRIIAATLHPEYESRPAAKQIETWSSINMIIAQLEVDQACSPY